MSEGLESDGGVGRFAQCESKGFRVDSEGPENSPWNRSQSSSDFRPVVLGILASRITVCGDGFWVCFQY